MGNTLWSIRSQEFEIMNDLEIWYPIFRPKFSLGTKFFRPMILLDPKYFWIQNYFWSQIFFRTFLPKFFFRPKFFDQPFLWTQNIFRPKILFRLISLFRPISLSHSLTGTKFWGYQDGIRTVEGHHQRMLSTSRIRRWPQLWRQPQIW